LAADLDTTEAFPEELLRLVQTALPAPQLAQVAVGLGDEGRVLGRADADLAGRREAPHRQGLRALEVPVHELQGAEQRREVRAQGRVVGELLLHALFRQADRAQDGERLGPLAQHGARVLQDRLVEAVGAGVEQHLLPRVLRLRARTGGLLAGPPRLHQRDREGRDQRGRHERRRGQAHAVAADELAGAVADAVAPRRDRAAVEMAAHVLGQRGR
jgi:hypothetical protein